MEIMFMLIGFSLAVALVFLVLFIVNVNKGQYDDMDTPAARILFENKTERKIK